MSTTRSDCDHSFIFQGTYWKYGEQKPGSSAYTVTYFDRYFCTRCLKLVDLNFRDIGNSYQARMEGSKQA